MFVRKKHNKSGSISVQVIDKTNGYRMVKTIGSSKDLHEIRQMVELGNFWVARQSKQYELFPRDEHGNAVLDFVKTLQNAQIRAVGPSLFLDGSSI